MDTPRARREAAIVAGCCDRGNADAGGAFISWQVVARQRLFYRRDHGRLSGATTCTFSP
ncbi:hypothetical protein ACFPOA_09145 [Lysobacter niabensis]|uniref:hypothetical protein n=1 Tax=Agrilutibacter niabensis TaxID=380628 RepID=UPI00361FC077